MIIRLLQITHDLRIGGLQRVVVNLCKALDRSRFDVSVLCLRDRGPFAEEIERMGIRVFVLPRKRNGTDYLSFLRVARVLQRERIDVIHTHNTQPLIDGTIGALLSGVGTVVHTDHARDFPDKRRYMFAEWLLSHFVFKMVGVSDHTCRNLMVYEGIAPGKVVTIPNGIDGSRFEFELDKDSIRRELGLPLEGPVIGLAVRLTEQKGITFLLKAMPKVIEAFPGVTLVIAGEGPTEQDLRRECACLGIEKTVRFVGPRSDVPELLKLFDLYVLPSVWEGLPMVLLEAMAAGCPIVATNVGGVPSAIRDGESGSLVEPGNPGALAGAIVEMLRDETLRNRYTRRGKEVFQQKYAAKNMARTYEDLYLRCAQFGERP